MTRGGIRSTKYYQAAKQYTFIQLSDAMPGKISPTDVDARHYVERKGHFLWWEYKTADSASGLLTDHVPSPQLSPICTLLKRGRPYDMAFICLHGNLSVISVDADLLGFAVLKYDRPQHMSHDAATGRMLSEPGGIQSSDWRPSGEMCHWVDHWFKHIAEMPNRLVTNFRRACGTYPGTVEW